jgi:hypothetical protein
MLARPGAGRRRAGALPGQQRATSPRPWGGEPLGIGGEIIYRVPPLSLPVAGDDGFSAAGSCDAVALFLERASQQRASLPVDEETGPLVVSICARLDGLPLAIELAAARLRSLSLSALADRLDQRFGLLTGGSRTAAARQQTLQATVEWSYALLTRAGQLLLGRLAVFAESFDLDAAEAVCGSGGIQAWDVAGLLGSLVGKSLLVHADSLDPPGCLPLYAEALACAERSGHLVIQLALHNNAGRAAFAMGDIPGARAHLEAGVQAAQALGTPGRHSRHRRPCGPVLADGGDAVVERAVPAATRQSSVMLSRSQCRCSRPMVALECRTSRGSPARCRTSSAGWAWASRLQPAWWPCSIWAGRPGGAVGDLLPAAGA